MRTINESTRRKAKTGVSYGWVSPVTRRRSTKTGGLNIVIKYFKLYCKYSSLVGVKYIGQDQTTWIERVLWVFVYVVTLSTLVFVVHGVYQEFVDAPIATTVDADYFPTHRLEFPGVAICTINRISRQSAVEMATEVANVSDLTVDEILGLILQLGDLYESTFATEDRHTEIDELLLRFYDGQYDITDVMKRLTPQCSIMLVVCIFHGERRNCSDIFAFRKTQDGFCCTFNYAREKDDIPIITKKVETIDVLHVDDMGIEGGLSVVMDPFLDDYFYTTLPIDGWKVTIFNPRDYPDVTSGGVSEILVTPLTERYVELDAISFYSTKSISPYPVEKRGCIFPTELLTMHAGYSYSDCLVDCKLDDIWKNCKCRPFYYPRRGESQYSAKICNTADIQCLAKYKSKWFTVIPHKQQRMSDFVNESWALHCDGCYPSCEDVNYVVRSSVSSMQPGVYKTPLLRDVHVVDHGVLHVYFTKMGTIRLKQDVIYRWYELLSDIGGLCGVFVGFSLISLVELAYFAVLMLKELCTQSSAPSTGNSGSSDGGGSPENDSIQAIYWSELLPRSRARARTKEPSRHGNRY